MAYAINLNADAAYVEQPSLFARLRQSFADYREYLAILAALVALGTLTWTNSVGQAPRACTVSARRRARRSRSRLRIASNSASARAG